MATQEQLITVEEMMAAVRRLNAAFDEVICIDDDHWKEAELRKWADPKERTLGLDWQHLFADAARNFEVVSRDQATFLEHLLRNPEAFRCWLRTSPF